MDLEERTGVERAGGRCEECGVELTPAELEVALERGGPVLCSVHASEIAPLDDDGDAAA